MGLSNVGIDGIIWGLPFGEFGVMVSFSSIFFVGRKPRVAEGEGVGVGRRQ